MILVVLYYGVIVIGSIILLLWAIGNRFKEKKEEKEKHDKYKEY